MSMFNKVISKKRTTHTIKNIFTKIYRFFRFKYFSNRTTVVLFVMIHCKYCVKICPLQDMLHHILYYATWLQFAARQVEQNLAFICHLETNHAITKWN